MKLQQLNEYEEQLNEASRSKVFAIAGSIFGTVIGVVSYAVIAAGLGTTAGAALPLAIVFGASYGLFYGGMASLFAKGKQRTLFDSLTKLIGKRDDLLTKIKDTSSKDEGASAKVYKKLNDISNKIKKVSVELDDLLDKAKGASGVFRRELSPREHKQLNSIIKAGKGESGDLLSLKYKIDLKKIK